MKSEINILIVDDDPSLLDQAKIFLEQVKEELNVIIASSAEEGLDLLDYEDIDVIVSDYQMPEINGLEFLEEIRNKREMDRPFIMFTGKGREEVAIEALNLGANRYLQKGGDPKSQYGVLAQAIEQEYEMFEKDRELKKSEEEKSKILEITSDEIAYHDTEHRITWANRSYLKSIGKSLEEIKGEKCYKVWYGRDQHCRGCPTERALKSGKREKGEISPSETDKYWLITAIPDKDEEGNIRGVIESSLDITELKDKENKIKKLFEASTELEDCTTEREIYEKVLKSVDEILGFGGCTILMEDEDELVIKATKAENVEEGEKYSKDEGIRGLTFQEKRPYIIEDISKWEEARPSDPNYKSAISIPIGEVGVFQGLSFKKDYFDESDLNLAETLISHMIQSIERIRFQEELKKSKKRFENVVLNAQEGIYIRDLNGKITYVNERFAEIHGYEKEELIGVRSWELLHPDSKEKLEEEERHNEKLLKQDDPEEIKIEKKDGEVRYLLTTNSVTTNIEGEKEIFGIVRDITERKNIEKELRRTKERFRTIFEEMKDAVYIFNLESDNLGEILEVNPRVKEQKGYSQEELLGMNIMEMVKDPSHIDLESGLKRLESGESVTFTEKGKQKDGTEVWIEGVVTPIKYKGKNAALSVHRDITERKEMEEELKKNKKRHETLFKENPEAIVEVNDDFGVVRVNEEFKDLFGYYEAEILSRNINDIVVPPDKMEEAERLNERSKKEGYVRFETVRLTKEGEEIDVAITARPVEYLEERHHVIVYKDITEQKEAEEELKKRNEKIKKLHERATELEKCRSEEEICELIVEVSEHILDFNVCGVDFVKNEKFVPIAFSSEIEGGFIERKVEEAGITRKVYREKESLLVKDRREIDFSRPVISDYRASITIPLENFGIFQALSTEVGAFDERDLELAEILVKHATEAVNRVKSEKKLKERMEKVEELHQTSAKLETSQSEEEVYSHALDAAEKILEFDMCGFDAVEGNKFVPKASSSEIPEDGHIDMPLDDAGMASKTYMNKRSYLIDDLKKERESKPVKTDYRAMISLPIGEHGVFQAVSTETDHFDEEDLKMAELMISHVKEALNRIEMKEREEFLHSLLRHDVQNKTHIVNGYLHILEEYDDIPNEAEEYIGKARNSIRVCDKIIGKVRKLRLIEQEDEIKEIDIDSVLYAILSEHKGQLEKENIDIEIEGSGGRVKGGTLLEEMFYNLIENSVLHSDCDKISIHYELEGEECIVTVEDDGKGIENGYKDKIFDRGFKKGEKAGSGLGMYLVKKIIESYDGSIEVKDSKLGGARFDIHLKRV